MRACLRPPSRSTDIKADYASLVPLKPRKLCAKLAEPDLATISWLHMLPGDLFIGRWIYRDSRQLGMGPWIAGPALLATFTAGPGGLVLYLLARTLRRMVARADAW